VGKACPRMILGLIALLLVTHLFLLGFFKITSLDTLFHLKEGELYLTTGSLPGQDPFAFTTEGREWIKYSWLADVLFYLVYAAGGFPGLVLLRLVLLGVVSLLLYRLLRECGLHPLGAILLVFAASLALRFRLFIRPEIITFLLLLTTLMILIRLQRASPWTAYALLPVFAVWVNVHGSYVFGAGLAGLVLLANLLSGTRAEPGWGRLRLGRRHARHLAFAVAALPIAGLLNPHGFSMLLFPFRQNRMLRLTLFGEWMDAWKLPGIDPVWWEPVIIFGALFLAYVAVASLLFVWEGRFDPVGWGIVVPLGVYAVFRNRAIPYFALAMLPLLALSLVRVAGQLPSRAPRLSLPRLERIVTFACLCVLGFSVVDQALLTRRFLPGLGVASQLLPEAAAAFMERYHLDGRVFNSYHFGSYLMWRRWPANQVFIDGRYDAILFDERILEEYLQAHRDPDVLNRITAKYGVEILVLDADPGRRIAYLTDHPLWARIYWDPGSEVFVQRNERRAAFIAAHEYRLTRPEANLSYLAAYRRDPEVWNRALSELRHALEDNPGNFLAWLGLAQEYRAVGQSGLEQRLEALTRAATLLAGRASEGRAYGERAETLLQLGRQVEAEAAARQALRLDENLLLPRSVLASVAEQRGAWTEARNQLQGILARLESDDSRVPFIREHLEAIEKRMQQGEGR
jgi:tetratricopeptide (TPR) repeat protein